MPYNKVTEEEVKMLIASEKHQNEKLASAIITELFNKLGEEETVELVADFIERLKLEFIRRGD